MAFTDLDICNLAIDRVSGDRIETMGEESPLGAFCQVNYPHKRDVVLGKYRWTFANAVQMLSRVDPAADPAEPRPCAHKYARPADLVGAVHAWRDVADAQRARVAPYVMDSGGFFWSDQFPLFAEYTAARAEANWPSWFRQLVVTAFAADLADFCQLSGKARDLRAEAWGTPGADGEGGLYAQARNEDSRHAPQRVLASGVDPGPLVASRYGFGGSGSPFAGVSVVVEPTGGQTAPFDFAGFYNSQSGN